MTKAHYYKGWTFRQHSRGHWGMLRLSDCFMSWHNSYDGCRRFIRSHGTADNPDQSYELSMAAGLPTYT